MKKKNKQFQSINCEQAIARFNDFIDNHLKTDAREELMNHLSECKHCMGRLEFEQLIKSKIHQLSVPADPAMKERIEKLIASL